MKVSNGRGAPIWVSARPDHGVKIVQSKSHVMVSAEEIPDFIQAILQTSNETHTAKGIAP